ncbi:hypothetical protein EIP91_009807 [Steccherinum ochraceum]|uniref:Uncharacterized protein n=1 Tax=Steccherinum ochraceum TaxID=92696 RepID=A0A4R0RNW3_9APHY|nr:hypothetical protein EIP91_009807 [Steccherinum ochraceum]
MSSLPDFDDPTQACIYLSPRDDLEDEGRDSEQQNGLHPISNTGDIPEGYELRLIAYKRAWEKCLERVQSIVRQLHAPVVSSVVSHIREAYDSARVVPGLPYAELPVIGVSLPDGSSMLNDVLEELDNSSRPIKPPLTNGSRKGKGRAGDSDDEMHDGSMSAPANLQSLVVHLTPSECPNLASAMRAIVSGVVDRPNKDDDEDDEENLHPEGPKRKPTTSLATYDINLLEAWYEALLGESDLQYQILVVLHDFEQFSTDVMQDVFEICSQHIPSLPLVFLLAMSTPSALSYLRGAFPRSTLTLLRLEAVSAPSGPDVLEDVLMKTFFDADFEPDVMLGPATLDYVVEFGTRHTHSVDTMLSILQLAHMKHFEEPATVLVHDSLLGTDSHEDAVSVLEQPESFVFLDTVLSRLWTDVADQPTPDQIQLDEESPSIESLLDAVSAARIQSRHLAQKMRIAFQTMYLVRKYMHSQGYKTTNDRPEENALELMTRVIRGRVNKEVKYLGLMVKKLNNEQLASLLQGLHHFFHTIKSTAARRQEEDARIRIINAMTDLSSAPANGDEPESSSGGIAPNISEWLVDYIESRLVRLDQGPLWNVWNTGITPFPSELINPAPRISIINALLHPYEILDAHDDLFGDDPSKEGGDRSSVDDDRQYALWELPDTSILFRRYMDSGRMINVYDWYESFAVSLDAQRGHMRRREKQSRPQTPKKKKGKGKGKAPATPRDVEMDDEDEELDEEAEEQWRIEVQARFTRALHELDFMGFIKHTGRKADHVIKTIYDIPD